MERFNSGCKNWDRGELFANVKFHLYETNADKEWIGEGDTIRSPAEQSAAVV